LNSGSTPFVQAFYRPLYLAALTEAASHANASSSGSQSSFRTCFFSFSASTCSTFPFLLSELALPFVAAILSATLYYAHRQGGGHRERDSACLCRCFSCLLLSQAGFRHPQNKRVDNYIFIPLPCPQIFCKLRTVSGCVTYASICSRNRPLARKKLGPVIYPFPLTTAAATSRSQQPTTSSTLPEPATYVVVQSVICESSSVHGPQLSLWERKCFVSQDVTRLPCPGSMLETTVFQKLKGGVKRAL
jgi:hypothetical protein